MDSTLLADIGGTYLRYRVGRGEVESCDSKGWEARLMKLIEAHPRIKRVGISFAGQVFSGKIRSAPNVAVVIPDIKQELEQRFARISVEIENDLKCAALAYQRHLCSDSVAVLYAGSGLGSALISEGKIVRGCENMAGEIGHISYRKAPFRCGCGKEDCLELFASGSGIDKHRFHFHLSGGTLDEWLDRGGQEERQIALVAAEGLAWAASLMITLYNPAILVVGGGMLDHNPFLRQRMKDAIKSRTFPPAWMGCSIVEGDLSNAPLAGAGLLFGENFWLE